ncbi:hypothetical protein AB4084_27615, partial [Lysobacter sp. 2RAB21]
MLPSPDKVAAPRVEANSWLTVWVAARARAALLLPQRQAQRRQHHQRQGRAQERCDRIAPPPLEHARPTAARADAERTVFAPASQVLGEFLD